MGFIGAFSTDICAKDIADIMFESSLIKLNGIPARSGLATSDSCFTGQSGNNCIKLVGVGLTKVVPLTIPQIDGVTKRKQ